MVGGWLLYKLENFGESGQVLLFHYHKKKVRPD